MYQAVMARNNMTYSFGNTPITGSAISTFVDNNLSWEKKKSYNVGIDLAFFNNRLEFTAEWYKIPVKTCCMPFQFLSKPVYPTPL